MSRYFIALFLITILVGCTQEMIPVKHEMRGVWVASVNNIDWPKNPQHSANGLRQEFIELASYHQKIGMNALVVQVRPATDAFYRSEYEPWSEWLTGTQGLAPEPEFDPLSFMIHETHARGMEFHAWFNPYRAVIEADSAKTALNHITRTRPGWFVKYGDNLYFDPGIPDARQYLVKVIGEVVRNYDVDAIHFDDYFYPYPINGLEFPDSLSFDKYGRDFSDLYEWRRNNVNELIRELNLEIKSIKPYVRFGISPFGVWRNAYMDPTGSESRAGVTNYDDLYADVLLWLRNGWIDYIVPQVYWHRGFQLADYEKLVDWWSGNSFGRHLYIGQAAYKIGTETYEEWTDPSEMPSHLRFNAGYPEVRGNVYFSSRSMVNNPLGVADSLVSGPYAYPAMVPPMPWIDQEAPQVPQSLTASDGNGSIKLSWAYQGSEEPAWFMVYRFRGKEAGDISDMRNLAGRVRHPSSLFLDRYIPRKGYYTYVITAVDRNNNESKASDPITVRKR